MVLSIVVILKKTSLCIKLLLSRIILRSIYAVLVIMRLLNLMLSRARKALKRPT